MLVWERVNSLPNNKFLDQSNFKAFADNILYVVQIMICVSYMVENIVGKGENAGYHIFSFSHNVFKGLFVRVVKSQDCVVKGYSPLTLMAMISVKGTLIKCKTFTKQK